MVKTHEDNSESRKLVTIECTRHGRKTRNTRGLTEKTRKRHATHTQFLECLYKVKLRYRKKEKDWNLNVTCDKHNHAMLEDPFQLKEHRCRDPDRAAACVEGAALRTARQPYAAARRIMRIKGLHLSPKDYYNLVKYSKARTPQQEVQYALKTLENRGFHVRIKENNLVEQDTRQAKQIQFFFFCNSDQILFARRYASHFLVQTDATFTTNANELPLSVIVCVTNTLKSFPIAYCFIALESADAFIFMNACMRELFFHDSCRGPLVILGDFAAGLTAAMVARRQLSSAELGIEVAYELAARLDEAGSDLFLQLCSWHAAEAIKKRLSRQGYPMEPRAKLVNLVWECCKKGCTQPLQYGLPCRCWMYECLPRGIPIPLSLIHPRWLFSTPDVVVGWKMSVDPSIGVEDYHNMTGEQDGGSSSSGDNDGEDCARSQNPDPGTPPGVALGGVPGGAPGLIPPISLSDRFENRGRTLIEKTAIDTYNYHQKLPDSAIAELYAAEYDKVINKFNTEFTKKYAPAEPLSRVFPQGKEEKDLKYKKGGSRRRVYTGREAAEVEEVEERRRRRYASIEAKRIAQHKVILEQDEAKRMKISASQGLMAGESGESGESGEDGEVDWEADVVTASDDDDV